MTERDDSVAPAWRADLALLTVVLIWGINIPVMKWALSDLHPFAFNVLRLTMSTAFLALLDAMERRRGGGATTRRRAPWKLVVALGLVGSLLYQVLFLVGMSHTTAGNTGLLVGTLPLWTAVIASLCGIDRIRSSAWLGLTVAFAGTAVIALEGGDLRLAQEHLRGNALVLFAMLSWAVFAVMSKPALAIMSPIRMAFLTSLIALPGHVALAVPHFEPVLQGQVGAPIWWAAAYSGLLSTGLAYALWNYGVRRLGPSHTAIYNNMVPVIALLASWLALGETITVTHVAAGSMILGGLFAMRRTRPVG